MAVAVTSLGITFNTTGGNTTVVATPAVNDLIVVVVAASGTSRNNAGTTALSDDNADGNGVYTRIVQSSGTDTYRADIWVRNFPVGSATSTTFTAAQAASNGGGLQVFKVTGITNTGVNAIRQSTRNNGALGTTPTVSFTNAVLTGNPVIAAAINASLVNSLVVPSGFTERANIAYSSPTISLETASVDSGFTSSTVTWGGTSATAWEAPAVEIDTSGGSTHSIPSTFNLPYRTPDDPNLVFTGVLYTPNKAKWGNGPWPAVVCTRAGGYTDGGPTESNDMLQYLSGDTTGGLVGQGYLCLFADVRLAKQGGRGGLTGQTTSGVFPQQTNDLMLAITYMRSHPLCNGFVAVAGGSGSGAHAMWIALTGKKGSTMPDAAICLSGQLDASDTASDVTNQFTNDIINYYGLDPTDPNNTATLLSRSPTGAIGPAGGVPPLYFANGTAEPMPFSVFTNFKAAADKAQVVYTSHVNTADGSVRHSFGTFPENQDAIVRFLNAASSSTGGVSGAMAPMGKLASISERMSRRGNILGPQTYTPIMSSKSRAQYAQLKAKTARGEELTDSEIELWNVLSGIYG